MSKPKLLWSKRLGGLGESKIESMLKYFSNPIKYEGFSDLGIDFYCELIENDSPSIPFYVQAKTSEFFDDTWGCSIKKTTILYWLNQLFPVFLIVYDEKEKKCYWMSIEDRRYEFLKKMETKYKTIYIQMERSHILYEGKDSNDEFITKIKDDFLSIEAWRGRPQFRGEGYVKKIPPPPRSTIEIIRNIGNIRMNFYSLIQYYLVINDLPNAYLYCDFLTKIDKSHYNHFLWFGRINKLLGKKEEAKKAYTTALEICNRDKKWPQDSMEKLKAAIKLEMQNV